MANVTTSLYNFLSTPEFREQLERLEILNGRVPPLVIREILDKHLTISKTSLYEVSEDFTNNLARWDKERVRMHRERNSSSLFSIESRNSLKKEKIHYFTKK